MERLEELIALAEETGESVRGACFVRESYAGLEVGDIDLEGVTFEGCRFAGCDFGRTSFYDCTFRGCDFSNGLFRESYWKGCLLEGCKGDGADFSMVRFKKGKIVDSSLCYANFYEGVLEESLLREVRCQSAGFQKVGLKKMTFQKVVFSGAEFFRTPLKGIDLSDCEIDGLVVSESFAELKGAKISTLQGADVARIMGMTVV